MRKLWQKNKLLIIAVGLIFLFRYMAGKFIDVRAKLVPFVQKWEGGLSRAKSDKASAYPSPYEYKGYSDWHTNMGVTYSAFEALAEKLGYEDNFNNFIHMPEDIWFKIAMGGYWNLYPMDEISHLPRIQAVIFTWAWGSGSGGSEKRLADFQRDYFNIVDNNITKKEIVANFKRLVNRSNEKVVFHALCDRRKEDFIAMNQPQNLKGWLNRLDEFRKTFA